MRFIIAPHEVDAENIKDVQKEFDTSVLYSNIEMAKEHHNVLIIDNVGMLSRLYRYAHVTYVGGGFGDDGVHNVLEAAVYSKPVIIGPVYEKFAEAIDLVECEGAISINNALEFEKVMNELVLDKTKRENTGIAAKNYVYQKAGATKAILNYIQEKRLLTN
jgi:3-deoxy-D-manno-octulosonic-acid transferase